MIEIFFDDTELHFTLVRFRLKLTKIIALKIMKTAINSVKQYINSEKKNKKNNNIDEAP